MREKRFNEDGFTLIELMWAMVLAVMLLGAVFGALQVGMRSSLMTSKTTFFVDQATSSIRVMQKYVRQASIISSAQPNYLRISVEKATAENRYDVYEFYISNKRLYERVNGFEKVLAENVRNVDLNVPLFRYYKEGGAEITDPTLRLSLTRSIKITLVVDDDLNNEPPKVTITETVFLRNFNL